MPPATSFILMAVVSHSSAQRPQTTPCNGRHFSLMLAKRLHGACWSDCLSTPSWQAVTHSSQKVHLFWLKSTRGNPLLSLLRMFSGQDLIQASQRRQVPVNSRSLPDQGGLMCRRLPVKSPRKNWALLIAFSISSRVWLSSICMISLAIDQAVLVLKDVCRHSDNNTLEVNSAVLI